MTDDVRTCLKERTREELVQAATDLADADMRFRHALVHARRAAGMTQKDVADAMGIKQSSVAAFERYDNDPRLSTVRRYATVVGASISHSVTPVTEASRWMKVELGRTPLTFNSTPQTHSLPGPRFARNEQSLAA